MAKTVAKAVEEMHEAEDFKDTKDRVQAFSSTAKRLKGEMDETRGELAQAYKQAEDDWNLNRQMFKWAQKLAGQDSAKGQQNLRDFLRYCNYLGVTDQQDLFDKAIASGEAA